MVSARPSRHIELSAVSKTTVLNANPAVAPSMNALASQARQGHSLAFETLCGQVRTRLLRQATLWCGDESLAQDLAQETLFEAWKSLARFNGQCEFFTWICAILHHRYLSYTRRKRLLTWLSFAKGEPEHAHTLLEMQSDPELRPDQLLQHSEKAALVRRCVAALPPKQQQVILLRFFVDNSLEGIAAAVGCSLGTVKSRLFHALENLRRMLALHPDLYELTKEGPI
jgi:RNA polymerase sigma-70 factor, ECF subfamily